MKQMTQYFVEGESSTLIIKSTFLFDFFVREFNFNH